MKTKRIIAALLLTCVTAFSQNSIISNVSFLRTRNGGSVQLSVTPNSNGTLTLNTVGTGNTSIIADKNFLRTPNGGAPLLSAQINNDGTYSLATSGSGGGGGGLPETPLAIVHGGTNATTSLAGIQNLTAEGSSIAAASTVDLSTATGPYLHVTGTGGPITSFGTVTTGAKFTLEFDAASSITQNSTSMKLLGGISVTNVAGSVRTMKSLGSGNWQELANNDSATAVTQTITGKRVTPRITTIVSSATPTINTDNADCVTITALATAITSMTTNLTGTPVNFDQIEVRIIDNGTPRAITWGASFVGGPVALPTTTVTSKALHVYLVWDAVRSLWVCMYSGSDA